MQTSQRRRSGSGLLSLPLLIIVPLLALLILGACAGDRSAATPTPTRTRRPTFTPVKVATVSLEFRTAAPATVAPSATPIAATPTSPAPTPLPPTAAPSPTLAPPTAAPTAPPRPTAVPATAAPKPPQPTAPPAPPPAADPCAGIGGDGCKWRVTGGPSFGANGGSEVKLQLLFIHSGIDGGQPQGSYFVVLEKDGQNLKVPDSVRSITGAASSGSLGKFNYEYAIGLDRLPGNNVAGNYTLWVLDGNGERDSRNVTFSVPAGQGQIWIQFDQS
ncbi:MAG: hypothetical protein MUC51_10830 [Anaerolineae bacterium]|jgi:hypothetical protein|nr:hypothetical protein [Anaerolineae bacterium]